MGTQPLPFLMGRATGNDSRAQEPKRQPGVGGSALRSSPTWCPPRLPTSCSRPCQSQSTRPAAAPYASHQARNPPATSNPSMAPSTQAAAAPSATLLSQYTFSFHILLFLQQTKAMYQYTYVNKSAKPQPTRDQEVAERGDGQGPHLPVVPLQRQQLLKLVSIPVLDQLVLACGGAARHSAHSVGSTWAAHEVWHEACASWHVSFELWGGLGKLSSW